MTKQLTSILLFAIISLASMNQVAAASKTEAIFLGMQMAMLELNNLNIDCEIIGTRGELACAEETAIELTSYQALNSSINTLLDEVSDIKAITENYDKELNDSEIYEINTKLGISLAYINTLKIYGFNDHYSEFKTLIKWSPKAS